MEIKIKFLTEQCQAEYIKEALDKHSSECTNTDILDIGREVASKIKHLDNMEEHLDEVKYAIEDAYDNYVAANNRLQKHIAFKKSDIGKMMARFCETHNAAILTQIEEAISRDNPWEVEIYTQERIDNILKNRKGELSYWFIREPHFDVRSMNAFYKFDNYDIDVDIAKYTSNVNCYKKRYHEAQARISKLENCVNSVEEFSDVLRDVMDYLDIDSECY